MTVIRIAAFSDGDSGGNPAGVHISAKLPSASEMQSIAAQVGYSETAFAENAEQGWRVRYFSPESEVPFCGHATIALGAALGKREGAGIHTLHLNDTTITVESFIEGEKYSAALQSPGTHSRAADPHMLSAALDLFGYKTSDLDPNIPPAFASGGANHLIIGLNSRRALSAMAYDLAAGRTFMNEAELVTVMLVYPETPQLFHARNPFASGGVYEDPATGAATAAFAGYLRDIQCPHDNAINIIQGEDMGSRSLIHAELTDTPGASIRVSGSVRFL
ncbi:MAG: PhzF family phenazine biosynthesis protein [Granulosicoccus sp.]|nr:PhzF family phenazine biosynthesis protein [Granulosicoccus sp.]